jgi:hypothetical protein
MEIRRHASSTPWGERVILGAYWLTSGYGLRGLHALGALFQYLGFDHARPTMWASCCTPHRALCRWNPGCETSRSADLPGKVLRILLRLTGRSSSDWRCCRSETESSGEGFRQFVDVREAWIIAS